MTLAVADTGPIHDLMRINAVVFDAFKGYTGAMETIVRNVRDIDIVDREALEHVVGLELHENQQLIIQVVSEVESSGKPQQMVGGLPDWCNVYEGLTDDEIDDIEKSIVRSSSGRSFD